MRLPRPRAITIQFPNKCEIIQGYRQVGIIAATAKAAMDLDDLFGDSERFMTIVSAAKPTEPFLEAAGLAGQFLFLLIESPAGIEAEEFQPLADNGFSGVQPERQGGDPSGLRDIADGHDFALAPQLKEPTPVIDLPHAVVRAGRPTERSHDPRISVRVNREDFTVPFADPTQGEAHEAPFAGHANSEFALIALTFQAREL